MSDEPGRGRAPRRSLNLGCGRDIRPAAEGWTNMDIAPLPGVDVVHDFLTFPWPFPDGSFDHVYASHVMEHIPHRLGPPHKKDGFIVVMEELHRVLAPGGTVEIVSPHHESSDRWADPTHTRVIHPRNFAYFEPGGDFEYYTTARFRTRSVAIEGYSTVAPTYWPMGRTNIGLTEHLSVRLPFLKFLLKRRPMTTRIVIERL